MEETKQDKQENIWEKLLAEASSNKRLPDTQFIVLGEPSSGKAGILDKIFSKSTFEASEHESLAAAEDARPVLHYAYIDAVDPSSNDLDKDEIPSRISVWALGDDFFDNLLSIPLTPEKISNTMFAITIDLSRPWDLMKSLTKWVGVIERAVKKTKEKLTVGDQDELHTRVKEYLDSRRSNAASQNEGDGALSKNLGVPLLVIGCKADMVQAEKFEQQQKLRFIQQHLRRFCLEYGASLVYTSARDGTNLEKVQHYLLHRLYPKTFDFPTEGQVTNEELFIPTGWDSHSLIDTLNQEKTPWAPDASFEVVILPPNIKTESAQPEETEAEVLKPEDDWLAELEIRPEGSRGVRSGGHKPAARAGPKTGATPQAPSNPATNPAHQKKDTAQIRDFFEGLLASGK